MRKLFDMFTVKRRYFVVKEINMMDVLKMFEKALYNSHLSKYRTNGITIGNCKWFNEPDSWFIHVDLTNKQWRTLLEECKEKKYSLVIKDIPDKMYFEKAEES